MPWEGRDAVRHDQQQARRSGVVPLAHRHTDQQVTVQQVEGAQQAGRRGGPARLQLAARRQQLVAGRLRRVACGEGGQQVCEAVGHLLGACAVWGYCEEQRQQGSGGKEI